MVQLRARRNRISYVELSGEGVAPFDEGGLHPEVRTPEPANQLGRKRRAPESGSEFEADDALGETLSKSPTPASDESLEESSRLAPNRLAPDVQARQGGTQQKDPPSARNDVTLASSRKPSVRDAQLRALQQSAKNSMQPKSLFVTESRLRLKEPPLSLGRIYESFPSRADEDTSHTWGNILAPGPVWGLVEDRIFYKELSVPDRDAVQTDLPFRRSSMRKVRGAVLKAAEGTGFTHPKKETLAYQGFIQRQNNIEVISFRYVTLPLASVDPR